MEKVIYFDDISDNLKKLILERVPSEITLYFWNELTDKQKEQEISQADYFMLTAFKIDKKILQTAKRIKFIQKIGIGLDNIDLETAKNLSVPVSNTPGGNSTSVSELTILFILALYRRLVELDRATKDGKWLSWEFRSSSYEMLGKTHGLIGMGNIGYETAKRSSAFGTKIVYYDTRRLSVDKEKELNAQYTSLEEVLKVSDIISLHVPLLPETKGLINMSNIIKMKKNAILINVARGGVVNEKDLYYSLKDRLILGAAIDAWEEEPISLDNPLLTLDNVISTPHIGGGTVDTFNRVIEMAFDNINRVRSGELPKYVGNN